MAPSASFPQSPFDSVPKPKRRDTQMRFSFLVEAEDTPAEPKATKSRRRESLRVLDNESPEYSTPPSRLDNVEEEPPSPETPVPTRSKPHNVRAAQPKQEKSVPVPRKLANPYAPRIGSRLAQASSVRKPFHERKPHHSQRDYVQSVLPS